MEHKKIIEILFKLEMDDLKDAEMLADYAKKICDWGDPSLSQAIASRGKARLNQLVEADTTIKNVMQRMKDETGVTTEDSMYEDLLRTYIAEQTEKIKIKLDTM